MTTHENSHNADERPPHGRAPAAAAEQAQRDALAQLQSVIDAAVDGILAIDERGMIEWLNPAARAIFGYTVEELIGKNINVLMPEPYHSEHDGYLRNYRDTGVRKIIGIGREVLGRRKDGTTFPLDLAVSEVMLADRRMFTGIVRDITDRKRGEQALRDSEARHRAILEAAVDGIITIDERGTIESLNPAAERLFGYAARDLIGRNVKLLMPNPYRDEHDRYLTNYRETGEKKIIGIGREVLGQRKDGSTFPLDLAVSEVMLGDRRVFTGVVRDITDRKRAERELVEAKDAAVAASTAKDQFLAVVSHELRTPLNPILAAVSYLEQQHDLGADVKEEVVSIRRNVEHEARLVDDLLNLTRITRGKIELHNEAVDVHGLLRTVLVESQTDVDEKGIQLATALRAGQHYVWADPTRIRQVLTNLLNNAIKFSDPGGEITVRTSDTADGRFRMEIVDKGIGMPPEVLARLFNPFEQGEQTITRRYGGLGLGLAISKGIIDLHGGQLFATSAGRGAGSTFVMELSVVPALPGQAAGAEPPPRGERAIRVLLVEDHVDTLRIMAKLLRALGYGVATASTVSEALRLCEQESVDLLVSDIGLPDGTGYDLLRQIGARRPIKAIAVSGFSQEEDRARSKQAGFAEHLTKPIDFQKLELALARVAS